MYLCNSQCHIPTDVLSLSDPKVKEAEITSLVPNPLLPNMSSQSNPHNVLPLLNINDKHYRFMAV